mmetsp:Transcript_53117/g.119225  ORF Transcript_53117/g.119225 Transcript_53117/m.119225 type:complete len:256 (-) Transcript_53117:113-880(-)
MDADVAEALAVAALGAEADKVEPLEVILARLDASKQPTLLPGQFYSEEESALAKARTSQRTRLRSSGLAFHPKPFSPARTTGGCFRSAGNLPQRDLTSWEQQKAITPERSWSQSAMTCVVHEGPAILATSSPKRMAQSHGHGAWHGPGAAATSLPDDTALRRPGQHVQQSPGGGQILRQSRPVRQESPSFSRKFAPSPETGPSAGGPFAGRRAVHDRGNAAVAWRTKADAAAASYSYLGPSATGPPLPDIHPLWS